MNEIKIANLARAKLRRRLDAKGAKKWPAIRDERQVKRYTTSFMQFSISRQASGDFKNIALGERAKLIAQEWKALSDEEKQVRDSDAKTSHHLTDMYKRNTRTSLRVTPNANPRKKAASTHPHERFQRVKVLQAANCSPSCMYAPTSLSTRHVYGTKKHVEMEGNRRSQARRRRRDPLAFGRTGGTSFVTLPRNSDIPLGFFVFVCERQ